MFVVFVLLGVVSCSDIWFEFDWRSGFVCSGRECEMLPEFSMAGAAISETVHALGNLSTIRINVHLDFNESVCSNFSSRRDSVVSHRFHKTLPSFAVLYLCKDDVQQANIHNFAITRILQDLVFPTLESVTNVQTLTDTSDKLALIPYIKPRLCDWAAGDVVSVLKRGNEYVIANFLIAANASMLNSMTLGWLNRTKLFKSGKRPVEVIKECPVDLVKIATDQRIETETFVDLFLPVYCNCSAQPDPLRVRQAISKFIDDVKYKFPKIILEYMVKTANKNRTCDLQSAKLACQFVQTYSVKVLHEYARVVMHSEWSYMEKDFQQFDESQRPKALKMF